MTQRTHFRDEYASLSHDRPVSWSSQLASLNPFFNSQTEYLRVCWRLRFSKLSFKKKHPVILRSHLRVIQAGTQLTLNSICNTHWIIQARKLVKSHISKCVPCVRFQALALSHQMGNLPSPRVQVSEAFSLVGVDLAGLLNIKMSFGRGHKSCKGYM